MSWSLSKKPKNQREVIAFVHSVRTLAEQDSQWSGQVLETLQKLHEALGLLMEAQENDDYTSYMRELKEGDHCQELQTWLGLSMSEKARIGESPHGGKGVFATEDIPMNTILFKLPISKMLSCHFGEVSEYNRDFCHGLMKDELIKVCVSVLIIIVAVLIFALILL